MCKQCCVEAGGCAIHKATDERPMKKCRVLEEEEEEADINASSMSEEDEE